MDKRKVFLGLVFGMGALLAAARYSTAATEPFAVDEHTVLLLHLDEKQGDPVDSGPNKAMVSNQGAGWITPGRFGWALNFNGRDNYLRIMTDKISALSEITIEAWVCVEEKETKNTIFYIGGSSSLYGPTLWLFADKGYISLLLSPPEENIVVWSGKADLSGGWHYVKAVWGKEHNNGVGQIYVDGVKVSGDGKPWKEDLADTATMFIGSYQPGWGDYYFQGKIDEVRISNRARE